VESSLKERDTPEGASGVTGAFEEHPVSIRRNIVEAMIAQRRLMVRFSTIVLPLL
jgi:hypothetical protein